MTKLNFSQFSQRGEVKTLNSCTIYDQAHLILPSGTFTRTDELPLGQNGNGFKTDKNINRAEIKRERNGNGTVLPVPLYGRQMEKILTPTNNHNIGKKQMKYLITTISALNQLIVITNLPSANPDE